VSSKNHGLPSISPPFLKGDLGGLIKVVIIPPDPPLEKGGR
jgi:hypothetical protein